MKMDVTAVGEVLVDLTGTGTDARGIGLFAANPGGAPANVAVAAARLGAKTAFVGKTGQDAFGDMLRDTLEENGVDVTGLTQDAAAPTTLAVVSVDAAGERSFAFYRAPGADQLLRADQLPAALLQNTRFVHFGSVSLTAEPARTATLEAVRRARAAGALVSYDPNFRPALWPDAGTALEQMQAALPLADLVKVNEAELELLTGTADLAAGTGRLAAKGAALVLVTLGERGVFWRTKTDCGTVAGVSVTVADTNGAGDTFLGAVLSRLARRPAGLAGLTGQELVPILTFANRAASVTVSRPGAIPAMPTLAQVEALP